MRLKNIEWKNIKSFGNKTQKIDFDTNGALWMILGRNGNGKCLTKDTYLEIEIEDKILKKTFKEFIKNK